MWTGVTPVENKHLAKQVPLTRGQYATVDDEDFERVIAYKWYASLDRSGKYYAKRTVGKHQLPLANFVLDVPRGTQVDHINKDPLDNRRANLRIASQTVQNRNRGKSKGNHTSQHVGVSYHTRSGMWRASIRISGSRELKRSFKTEAQALAQRKLWEQEYNWPIGINTPVEDN